MSIDYKYALQLAAEDLAAQETGNEFYSLPPDKQDKIYRKAYENYREKRFDVWDAREK